jgi:putative tRNA adenosine deaminase-associated protein
VVWAGDVDILEDLGVSGNALRRLVEEHDEDPAAVIADLGERVGFGELVEALR